MADELSESQQKQAYEAIRAGIIHAAYRPGVRLPMKRLTEELDLGRTPIREALVRLTQEELVYSVPHSGTYVSPIDLHAAESARYVRKNLETAVAVECCSRGGDEILASLGEVLERQCVAAASRDAQAFYTCDGCFYRRLFEAVGKEEVWLWIDGFSVSLDRVRWLSMLTEKFDWDAVVAQHAAVRDAIEARDANEVCRLETQYLNGLLAYLDVVRERFPEYFAE